MFSVRFVKSFELTLGKTNVDENGNLTTTTRKVKVEHGDIHLIDRRSIHPNTVDLFFSKQDPFNGSFSLGVPKDCCEFLLPSTTMVKQETRVIHKRRGGCGGCNKKKSG